MSLFFSAAAEGSIKRKSSASFVKTGDINVLNIHGERLKKVNQQDRENQSVTSDNTKGE